MEGCMLYIVVIYCSQSTLQPMPHAAFYIWYLKLSEISLDTLVTFAHSSVRLAIREPLFHLLACCLRQCRA